MEQQLRKEARVSSSEEINNDEENNGLNRTSNTERYLTYDVLRIIFKYLNGMDLSNASMVCRLWMEAANSEKHTRGPVYLKKYHIEIGGQNQQRDESLEWKKANVIQNLRIKPKLGLFFTRGRIAHEEKWCHCKYLPPNCDSISLGVNGIVMNKSEIENNYEYYVCAFLPEIPNVSIKTFILEDMSKRIFVNPNEATRKKCFEDIIEILESSPNGKSDESKCLMLFSSTQNKMLGKVLATAILDSLEIGNPNQNFSLWGGIVSDLWVSCPDNNKKIRCGKSASCVAITLTGSGLKTWSIIIDYTCRTKERVEDRLRSFRECIELRKHSLGFMFACCDRGVEMFNERNVESSIFKSLFPEVPLMGCFGGGEYGGNSIPTIPSNEKETRWFNQLSTVFLILTYG